MPPGKNLYFASDFHLGAGTYASSRERESRIIRWLDTISDDVGELFLMGDVFDFWFEYKTVVPKGYTRFFGKLAQLSDRGVTLYFFKGNHDMWLFDYLKDELNAIIISNELEIERNGKKFYLHHGDGLGPGDKKYKFLKKIFRSTLCQWAFARIHPDFGIRIANAWSGNSKQVNARIGEAKLHPQEWLEIYSKEILKTRFFDYMIYGHRHRPLDLPLPDKSRYVNLGDWINYFTYAVFDGETLELKHFEPAKKQIGHC